jgi:hypothetical protein
MKWLFKALAKTWGELAENFEASKGLVIAKVYSVYEDEDDFEDKTFEDLLDDESALSQEETQLSESVNKSLDMFRRFKNFM